MQQIFTLKAKNAPHYWKRKKITKFKVKHRDSMVQPGPATTEARQRNGQPRLALPGCGFSIEKREMKLYSIIPHAFFICQIVFFLLETPYRPNSLSHPFYVIRFHYSTLSPCFAWASAGGSENVANAFPLQPVSGGGTAARCDEGVRPQDHSR